MLIRQIAIIIQLLFMLLQLLGLFLFSFDRVVISAFPKTHCVQLFYHLHALDLFISCIKLTSYIIHGIPVSPNSLFFLFMLLFLVLFFFYFFFSMGSSSLHLCYFIFLIFIFFLFFFDSSASNSSASSFSASFLTCSVSNSASLLSSFSTSPSSASFFVLFRLFHFVFCQFLSSVSFYWDDSNSISSSCSTSSTCACISSCSSSFHLIFFLFIFRFSVLLCALSPSSHCLFFPRPLLLSCSVSSCSSSSLKPDISSKPSSLRMGCSNIFINDGGS